MNNDRNPAVMTGVVLAAGAVLAFAGHETGAFDVHAQNLKDGFPVTFTHGEPNTIIAHMREKIAKMTNGNNGTTKYASIADVTKALHTLQQGDAVRCPPQAEGATLDGTKTTLVCLDVKNAVMRNGYAVFTPVFDPKQPDMGVRLQESLLHVGNIPTCKLLAAKYKAYGSKILGATGDIPKGWSAPAEFVIQLDRHTDCDTIEPGIRVTAPATPE